MIRGKRRRKIRRIRNGSVTYEMVYYKVVKMIHIENSVNIIMYILYINRGFHYL